MSAERIGLFGGSFDPVHLGHVRLAAAAKSACGLDRVVILPAACSPFKTGVFSLDADRFEMCRLSFPGAEYTVSDFELKKGGRSYTVETVRHFRALYPDASLFLILGEDQLLIFDTWYRFREILENAGLIAAARTTAENVSALEAFADRRLRAFGSVTVLPVEPFPVSSTEIRARVSAGGSVSGLVSEETERYILEKRLYFGL